MLTYYLASNDKPKEPIPGLEGLIGERVQEEEERENLRVFLDQCQTEFRYLMITPANPMPPRDSPPLPMIEDMREGEYGVPAGMQPLDAAFRALHLNQNHVKDPGARPQANHAQPTSQTQIPNLARQNVQELHAAPMARTNDNTGAIYNNPSDWPAPVGVALTSRDDAPVVKTNHNSDYPRQSIVEETEKRGGAESDGWDFGEGAFPETTSSQPLQNLASQRPDTDVFPAADNLPKSPNRGPSSHRRKTSLSRRRSLDQELSLNSAAQKAESGNFKLRYGLRGHLNTVRTVIFSGGGSPGEPEICTAGDDGLIKRFHIPRETPSHLSTSTSDLDVPADFTHRGHSGAVLCLTAWSPAPNFSTGGRAQGDGWIFSGGQDASIRVWERGRVDPKATLDGHTDAVWAICVLPATLGAVFGQTSSYGSPDRILLASGSADGAVKIWAVSAPPQLTSPQPASGRRATGSRGRGNSMSSGSQFPNSPQPSVTSNTPFHSTLVHSIVRANGSQASPTYITPLSANGETFVVSYSDAAIIVYDTRTGEEIGTMASLETFDGTPATSVNAVVATTVGLEQSSGPALGDEDPNTATGSAGPTGGGNGAGSGIEGVIISGHEDRYVRFFDANSGKFESRMSQWTVG